MEVLQVAVGKEIRPSEVVLQVLLLTSMLKTKLRFHLLIIRQLLFILSLALRAGGGVSEGHLLIMQETLSEGGCGGLPFRGADQRGGGQRRGWRDWEKVSQYWLLYRVEINYDFFGKHRIVVQ